MLVSVGSRVACLFPYSQMVPGQFLIEDAASPGLSLSLIGEVLKYYALSAIDKKDQIVAKLIETKNEVLCAKV